MILRNHGYYFLGVVVFFFKSIYLLGCVRSLVAACRFSHCCAEPLVVELGLLSMWDLSSPPGI